MPDTRLLCQRKGRELNPQGSSLGRFRNGCRRRSACPSKSAEGGEQRAECQNIIQALFFWPSALRPLLSVGLAAVAGLEPAIVSLTGSCPTIGPHRSKSGRWDSNPRLPVPETGGFARLSYVLNQSPRGRIRTDDFLLPKQADFQTFLHADQNSRSVSQCLTLNSQPFKAPSGS